MNVTIHLPPEAASQLSEKAAQQNVPLEEYLSGIALNWLRETNALATGKTAEQKNPEERSAAWQEWVAGHPPGIVVADDSRESIYAGRGE